MGYIVAVTELFGGCIELIRKGHAHSGWLLSSTATSSVQSNKELYGFSGTF
jgi:hypothetical protein